MREWKIRSVITAATMIILAACSGADSMSPLVPEAPQLEVGAAAKGTGGTTVTPDTSYGYMMVGSAGGNWVFGDHKINFPANSICDMSQTNYFEWGKPCTPIASTIRIDLKWWRDADGHPHVEFEPALRFQPTKRGEVTLYLKDQEAARAANPVIKYCPLSGVCIDESVFDSALITKKDNRGGFVYRIIRHFSGYNVWA